MIWPLMTLSPPPSCIVFDFDGVLVNSLPLHLDAWVKATAQIFGVCIDNPQALKGHATRTIAGILAKRFGDPSLAPTLVRVKQQILTEDLTQLQLIHGAREFLDAARRSGIPHGIASNSRRDFVTKALAATQISVPLVVCAEDVARPKPSPAIFWECARRLGITSPGYSQVVVFEDSIHGIKAAVAARMVPVGLTTENTREPLLRAGAHETCTDLGEALAQGFLEHLPQRTGSKP